MLKVGDQVKHTRRGHEGEIKELLAMVLGTNSVSGILVEIRLGKNVKREVWWEDEVVVVPPAASGGSNGPSTSGGETPNKGEGSGGPAETGQKEVGHES